MKITATILAALLLAACSSGEATRETDSTAPRIVVDTLFPIPEAVDRFLATIDEPAPLAVTGGAESLEEMFRRLVDAYERKDTESLDALALTRAEFGYLYYPHSPYPEPPYEIDPEFLWYLIGQRGSAGINKALERFADRGSSYVAHDCPGATREEGGGVLWGPCLVTIRTDGAEDQFRLVNAVLERDGRFKLVGFDNNL